MFLSFHVRRSLNITPNNLTKVTLSISFFLIVKTDSFDNVFVVRELNKMYFVFLILRESLFAISQLSMLSSVHKVPLQFKKVITK